MSQIIAHKNEQPIVKKILIAEYQIGQNTLNSKEYTYTAYRKMMNLNGNLGLPRIEVQNNNIHRLCFNCSVSHIQLENLA